MTTLTKGLRLGMRTGLHDAWKKTGKPVVSQLAQLPFRNEAADLISSLWQRGATLQKSCLGGVPGAYRMDAFCARRPISTGVKVGLYTDKAKT